VRDAIASAEESMQRNARNVPSSVPISRNRPREPRKNQIGNSIGTEMESDLKIAQT